MSTPEDEAVPPQHEPEFPGTPSGSDRRQGARAQDAAQAMTAAEEGLHDVQAVLQGAAKGQVRPDQLVATLQGYLETHGPALQASLETVGEEVRQQALSQLYAWRAQLKTQMAAQAGDEPHGETHSTGDPSDPRS